MHVRVCRECGEEFRPGVALCSDCGGELEDRLEGPRTDQADAGTAAPAPRAGPGEDLTLAERGEPHAVFVADQAAGLEPFARVLGAARIPFAVEVRNFAFALVVGEQDLPQAIERLQPLLGDAAEPHANHAPGACPACGAELEAGAAECPECGLSVSDA